MTPAEGVPDGADPDGAELVRRRLHNAGLTAARFEAPERVVRWFGAVQSQDYGPAKWSLGQRVEGATDAAVDAAFDSGAILRTHALRPTWHFVDPADAGSGSAVADGAPAAGI